MSTEVQRSVHKLLVSGSDAQISRFHLNVCLALNAIERRGATVYYTCLAADLVAALESAGVAGVTVQAVEHVGGHETYRTLVKGAHPEWRPSPKGVGEGGSAYYVAVTCVACSRFWVEETQNAGLLHKSVACAACG